MHLLGVRDEISFELSQMNGVNLTTPVIGHLCDSDIIVILFSSVLGQYRCID